MAKLNPIVVIPVHRPEPTEDEQFTLRRCGAVLATHPIRVVHPEALDLAPYRSLLPEASSQPVPDSWMASIRAYNRMMVNPAFYALFADFSHMLIHEPDALVLKDELLLWCQKPFDYIGAPWFEGFSGAKPDSPIIGVGNSGFSLIRVQAMACLLSSRYRWLKRSWIFRQLLIKFLGRQVPYSYSTLLRSIGRLGTLQRAHHLMTEHWDFFLSYYASLAVPGFRIASISEALLFSWEVNPDICRQLNEGKPPFGIHAWARYDKNLVIHLLQDTFA